MKAIAVSFLRAAPAFLFGFAFLFFETAATAVLTLCAILLHECGHLLAFSLLGEPQPRFSAAAGGFRFLPARTLSYRNEVLVCAAGPLANLFAAALFFSLASSFSSAYLLLAAWLQLLTGLGNLLPVGDLDGGRMLSSGLSLALPEETAVRICRAVSVLSCALGLFFSLLVLYLSGACFYASLFFLFFLLSLP